ncbi:MAG TPA: outer membrane beta-barrel protein [Sphingomonas sp.]|nr:outer membrane beta-barrel protein [Sphingomonas sp.]
MAYAQSFAWWASASPNECDFRIGTIDTPQRGSQGHRPLAGVGLEPAARIRGGIGVGYISQTFRCSHDKNLSRVGFHAKVQLFPSQLITMTVQDRRAMLDLGVPGSAGYLSTEGGIPIDYEFFRQMILSGSVGHQNNRFNNLDRVDHRIATRAGATYRLNRTASPELRYDRLDPSSHGADRDRAYVDNRLMAGVTLRR